MNRDRHGGNSNNPLFNNKYEQVRLLGEGSFGKAFLVECIDDRAIDLGNMSEDEKGEAIQEGKILEKLDHPNIIKFKEVYIDDKSNKQILNIVMDFADGGDLQQRIRGQKGKFFNETTILDWFTQICLSIKHIHDRKILHRDIKSQNIFLTKNGLVKLGDFGIAKCLNKTMDKAKTIVGTPYYLSPEIVQNRPYSFKSDIWSLGVLLYEMCALKMPFDAQNLPLLSLKIIRCSYNPLPPNFSRELRSLVNIMLSVDTNKRFSINEVLRQPIIKSRIKNFLNEVEFNKEFSHTILHNFKLLRNNGIKLQSDFSDINYNKENRERENISGNNKYSENDRRDNAYNSGSNNKEVKESKEKERERDKEREVNFQKPIIKKDSLGGVGVQAQVVLPNKKKNYHYEVNSNNPFNIQNNIMNKEKEIENNINNLKKNLSNNPLGKERPPGILVNPSYEKDACKPKIRSSLEIDSNRTPKFEVPKVMPDTKSSIERRCSDKKAEVSSNLVYENLKRNNINKKKELNLNLQKDILPIKKNSESTPHSNLSTNFENQSERKRSESRGSQGQDEKDRPIQLKDFVKNMKENMKNNPAQSENVIWMKGMKEFIDKERVVEREKPIQENIGSKKDNETKTFLININPNIPNPGINFTNNSTPNKNNNLNEINYNFKSKNAKDIKDYIETQKMLIELEKLQDEELEEDNLNNLNDIDINLNNFPHILTSDNQQTDILNEFKDLNEDLIEADDNYFNNRYDQYIEKENIDKILSYNLESDCYNQTYDVENSLRNELELEVGKDLYNKVYKILSENLNSNIFCFDLDCINHKIKSDCNNYDEMSVDLSIIRIPDIYALVIKDRERNNM